MSDLMNDSRPLQQVTPNQIYKFYRSEDIFKWANQEVPPPPGREGMTAAYTVMYVEREKMIARGPKSIEEQHHKSQKHMFLPPDDIVWELNQKDPRTFATGLSRQERTATTHCALLQMKIAQKLGIQNSHLQRGFVLPGPFGFQGLPWVPDTHVQDYQRSTALKTRDSIEQCLGYSGPKLQLRLAEKMLAFARGVLQTQIGSSSPLSVLPTDLCQSIRSNMPQKSSLAKPCPVAFRLPTFSSHETDVGWTKIVIFAYRRGGPGMTLPYGIAPLNCEPKMKNWHVEPGGPVLIALTHNFYSESAGYWISPDYDEAQRNFKIRKTNPKHHHLHDVRLLSSLPGMSLSLDMCNYICAGLNTLPVTRAANLYTDPLVTRGGAQNRKFFDGPFALPRGTEPLPPDEDWPPGIRPPEALRDFMQWFRIRLHETFLDEAHKNPTGFLCLFPSFGLKSKHQKREREREASKEKLKRKIFEVASEFLEESNRIEYENQGEEETLVKEVEETVARAVRARKRMREMKLAELGLSI